jgi:hypothetical protein
VLGLAAGGGLRDRRGAGPLSERPAGALAGIAMILLLAAPAGAEARPGAAGGHPVGRRAAAPARDVVLGAPATTAARISATATPQRYPIDDGSDATVAVAITDACRAECDAANPQAIADFVGTLVHGREVNKLTIQLDTPFQLGFDCGFDAEACYYSGRNRMVISGNAWTGIGGATREFVIAHEYGHHLAQHRTGPAPFSHPIDWGTPRWASRKRICQGTRAGAFFPGWGILQYFREPGEAFAESFARNRFPRSTVRWRWLRALRPGPAALRAIGEDALSPWRGRHSLTLRGRLPRRGAAVRWLRTPLDGRLSLRPVGRRHGAYRIVLRSPRGRVLRTSRRLSRRHELNFTVCGQARVAVAIRSTRRSGGAFDVRVQRP